LAMCFLRSPKHSGGPLQWGRIRAIVVAFVDLGWNVEATSETCGQDLDLKAALTAAVLHSTDTSKTEESV